MNVMRYKNNEKSNMKAIKLMTVIIQLLISLPIWYYLMYKILQSVNASELMWFLYWIYLPVGIVSAVILKIVEINK